MRRIVTGPFGYLAALARSAALGWDAFFFKPADPTPLGLMRVVVGGLLFWSLFVFGLDLPDYFGTDGWIDPAALKHTFAEQSPYAWTFWTSVPDGALRVAWVGALAVLALYILGLFSRVTGVLAWLIVVATARRVPVALYGFDQAISTWAFYLAVTGASGQAVSLDRFIARWRLAREGTTAARRRRDGLWPLGPGVPTLSVSANLAIRLIQLHLCVIYGMAGLAKLQGPAWWVGEAVWGTLAAGEFRLFDLTWLASYPLLLNVMTHGSLALEVTYPILVWNRTIRPLLLACVTALHAGVGLTLGLTEFSLAMIAANLAFVRGSWLRSLVTGLDPSEMTSKVLYDGGCPRCRGIMCWISAADPDRLIEPIDLTAVEVSTVHPSLTSEACMRSMHLVGPDGRVFAGYDAVTRIGRLLPPLYLFGLVGSLPGMTWAGRRAYNAIASRRARDGVCNDEVCSVPPRAPAARRR